MDTSQQEESAQPVAGAKAMTPLIHGESAFKGDKTRYGDGLTQSPTSPPSSAFGKEKRFSLPYSPEMGRDSITGDYSSPPMPILARAINMDSSPMSVEGQISPAKGFQHGLSMDSSPLGQSLLEMSNQLSANKSGCSLLNSSPLGQGMLDMMAYRSSAAKSLLNSSPFEFRTANQQSSPGGGDFYLNSSPLHGLIPLPLQHSPSGGGGGDFYLGSSPFQGLDAQPPQEDSPPRRDIAVKPAFKRPDMFAGSTPTPAIPESKRRKLISGKGLTPPNETVNKDQKQDGKTPSDSKSTQGSYVHVRTPRVFGMRSQSVKHSSKSKISSPLSYLPGNNLNGNAKNDAIMKALDRSDENPNQIGDFSCLHVLPLVAGKHPDLKSISPETLADLIHGKFADKVESFAVLDCRYGYEFLGGHIRGAFNTDDRPTLQNFLFSMVDDEETGNIRVLKKDKLGEDEDNDDAAGGLDKQEDQENDENSQNAANSQNSGPAKRKILIFHCEFSSERAPGLCRFLRDFDRQVHLECYPKLHYPEIYLLDGGYKAFHEKFQELCEPDGYVPMKAKPYKGEWRKLRMKAKSCPIASRSKLFSD